MRCSITLKACCLCLDIPLLRCLVRSRLVIRSRTVRDMRATLQSDLTCLNCSLVSLYPHAWRLQRLGRQVCRAGVLSCSICSLSSLCMSHGLVIFPLFSSSLQSTNLYVLPRPSVPLCVCARVGLRAAVRAAQRCENEVRVGDAVDDRVIVGFAYRSCWALQGRRRSRWVLRGRCTF